MKYIIFIAFILKLLKSGGVMKKIQVIGQSVVDLSYDFETIQNITQRSSGKIGADPFFVELPSLLPGIVQSSPRDGDCIFVPVEHLHDAAKKHLHNRHGPTMRYDFNRKPAMEYIWGVPEILPAGALANTVFPIGTSKYNGQPVADIEYITVQDEGEAGRIFADSLPGITVNGPKYGECLKIHIIPSKRDRTMINALSNKKATGHYNLSPYIKDKVSPDTDILMFEGYFAFTPHFQSMADQFLESILSANAIRDKRGDPPIHAVVTIAAQDIANMPAFREFIYKVTQITDASIHSAAGEFRRLWNKNDVEWRFEFNEKHGDPFKGLEGEALENKKLSMSEYREAKTAANIHTIENLAISLGQQSRYNTRFIITDGGNPAYAVENEEYLIHHPEPLDTSQPIHKAGAGDNYMGGFWTAQLLGLDLERSMTAGDIFAKQVMKNPSARLSLPDAYGYHETGLSMTGPVALLPHAELIGQPPQQILNIA